MERSSHTERYTANEERFKKTIGSDCYQPGIHMDRVGVVILVALMIVVGSSISMMDAKRGHEVDKFDAVIRCNRAPTNGYAEYVGSRTDLRYVNNHLLFNNQYREQDLGLLPSVEDELIMHMAYISDKDFYGIYKSSCHSLQFSPYQWQSLLSRLGLEVDTSHNPTMGFYAICNVLEQVDEPLTIYGFDLNIDDNWIPHDYYQRKKRASSYHRHGYEKRLLNEMLELNLIKEL